MFGVDDALLAAVVAEVAKALAAKAAGLAADKVLSLLKTDPEKEAFKVALAETIRDFKRAYPHWAPAFSDRAFLTGQAAPVLARALLREGPDARDLAQAYVAQYGKSWNSNERAVFGENATEAAADFLARLEVALSRQRLFQAQFDSRALDATARYVHELLQLFQAQWAADRQRDVRVARQQLIRANNLFKAMGNAAVKGREVSAIDEAEAPTAQDEAVLAMDDLKYSGLQLLQKSIEDVQQSYTELLETVQRDGRSSANSAALLAALDARCNQMRELILRAPKI